MHDHYQTVGQAPHRAGDGVDEIAIWALQASALVELGNQRLARIDIAGKPAQHI
jgi:hypothetical protein